MRQDSVSEKYESAGRKQECTGAFRDCEDGWKTIYRQRRDDSERREKQKKQVPMRSSYLITEEECWISVRQLQKCWKRL